MRQPGAEGKSPPARTPHSLTLSPCHPVTVSPCHATGRLAPSPTGAQHVGNARTYLLAWLSARSQGGRVVLRIEDVDSPRVKAGAAEQGLEDLAWLGLNWDGPPVVQTQRRALHEEGLNRLRAAELVYPCTCTRADVERAASAPHLDHEGPVYPGTCSHRRAGDAEAVAAEGKAHCWRFRVPPRSPVFDDVVRGQCAIDLRQLGGDFVVWKAARGGAGGPAYQLCVVIDDADQGVTEVVRGDDLVPSTPRQLLLYEALGLPSPRFAHVPLVVGPDGRRLAKRHGDTRLASLREAGVSPGRLRGLLASSGGWAGRGEEVSIEELLHRFRWETVPREPFVLTAELLRGVGYALGE